MLLCSTDNADDGTVGVRFLFENVPDQGASATVRCDQAAILSRHIIATARVLKKHFIFKNFVSEYIFEKN